MSPSSPDPAVYPNGTIEPTEAGAVLRFERRLLRPAAEVWAAIIEPARLADWWLPFEADITVDLRPGGLIVMSATGDEPVTITCRTRPGATGRVALQTPGHDWRRSTRSPRMPTNQKLVVRCLMMSVDGFAAGRNQRLEQPFGDHTEGLTDWMFATRSGCQMLGLEGGEANADDAYVAHSFDNIGAAILGRNMFGTSRGPWTDDGWNGWWGPNPPYHAPTFVLTHHPREPIPMEGGTTFHFATGGLDDTLERAFTAAKGMDVRLMGGAATVRQYLAAELVDELHLVVVPMLIGRGERIFPESSPPPGYTCTERTATPAVIHLRFERS